MGDGQLGLRESLGATVKPVSQLVAGASRLVGSLSETADPAERAEPAEPARPSIFCVVRFEKEADPFTLVYRLSYPLFFFARPVAVFGISILGRPHGAFTVSAFYEQGPYQITSSAESSLVFYDELLAVKPVILHSDSTEPPRASIVWPLFARVDSMAEGLAHLSFACCPAKSSRLRWRRKNQRKG